MNINMHLGSYRDQGHQYNCSGSTENGHPWTDCGPQYGLKQQDRPWITRWPLDAALMADTIMVLGSSRGHSYQHGLPWQCGPQTSTWLQAEAQTSENYLAFGGNRRHGH